MPGVSPSNPARNYPRHWPLKSEVRDLVRRLGCARRGCRAGTRAPKRAVTFVYNQDACGTESAAGKIPVICTEHRQPYSVPAAHRTNHTRRTRVLRTVERTAADSHRATPVEIPTVSNVRRATVVNNEQLTSRHDDTVGSLPPVHDSTTSPLSTGVWASVPKYPLISKCYQHDAYRGLQPVVDSTTTLPSTCVWASVPETLSSPRMSQLTTPVLLPQSKGDVISPVHSVECRPNLASTPKSELLHSQADRYSLSCKSISGSYDSISHVQDVTSILSQPVNLSTLTDFDLQSLFNSNPYDNDSHSSLRNVPVPSSCDLSFNHQPLTPLTLSDLGLHALFDLNNSANENHIHNLPANYTTKQNGLKQTLPCFPNIWLSNIRGGLVSKVDEITNILTTNRVDIGAVTESWLHEGIDTQLIQVPGYNVYRRDRGDGRSGGGVLVYVKNDQPCVPISDLQNPQFEVVWLSFRANRMPRNVTHLLVGVVYHPPGANNTDMNEYLVSSIDSFSRSHPYCGVIVLGDFNRLPEGPLRSYPLKQCVVNLTRDQAVLDKIFTSVERWYKNPLILPAVSNSDHFSVIFQPTLSPPSRKGQRIFNYRRSCNPTGQLMLCYTLQRYNWKPLYAMDSCDDQIQYFYTVLLKLLDEYLPYVHVTKYTGDKPWVTQQFKDVISRRQRALLSGNLQEYSKLRNRAKRMSLTLKKRYYDNKVRALHDADPHSWWKRTKQFLSTPDSDPLSHLSIDFGQTMAETINDYFVGISQDLPPVDSKILELLKHDTANSEFIIQPYQVAIRLAKLNIYKAPGRIVCLRGF